MSTKQSHGLLPQMNSGQQKNITVTSAIGYNATHVIIQFNVPIQNFMMTPDQCRDHINALQNTLTELEKKIAGGQRVQ